MFVSVTSLANTFILAGKEENIPITPMKLQRLLYLAYKKYLKENGLPLFSTRFEAWKYGPVIRFLHDKLKHYKDNPIEELIEDGSGSVLVVKRNDSIKFMKEIWDNYKSYNGIELSDMICKKGFAWKEAIMNGTFILSDDDIKCELDY